MTYLSNILFLATTLVLVSCSKVGNRLNETFTGYWSETELVLHFSLDGTYELITRGHFGNTQSEGEYVMLDTTLFLLPYSDGVNISFGLGTQFAYSPIQHRLSDLDNHFYFADTADWRSIDYDLYYKIEERLLLLPDIKKYILRDADSLSHVDSSLNPYRVEFRRVRTHQRKHYLEYRLMQRKGKAGMDWYRFERARLPSYLVNVQDNTVCRESGGSGQNLERVDVLLTDLQ